MEPVTTLLSLPMEIRALIYEEVLPRRLITVLYGFGCLTLKICGRLLPPTIFQVCRQIRMEALSSYKGYEMDGTVYSGHRHHVNVMEMQRTKSAKEKVQVYISHIYDTIYIPANVWDITYFMDCDFWKSGRLAVAFDGYELLEWYINLRAICQRHNIKELLFVVLQFPRYRDSHHTGSLCDLNSNFLLLRHKSWTLDDMVRHIDEHINTLERPLTLDNEDGERYRRDLFLHKKGKAADENVIASCSWSLMGFELDRSSLTRKWTVCTRFSG